MQCFFSLNSTYLDTLENKRKATIISIIKHMDHMLIVFDQNTGSLLGARLRADNVYISNYAKIFLVSIFETYVKDGKECPVHGERFCQTENLKAV